MTGTMQDTEPSLSPSPEPKTKAFLLSQMYGAQLPFFLNELPQKLLGLHAKKLLVSPLT